MALSKQQRQEIITKFGKNENDSGSTEVQIALMTAQIAELTKHFQAHKQDSSSKRGLQILIGKRRGLLDYLKKTSQERYVAIVKALELRR